MPAKGTTSGNARKSPRVKAQRSSSSKSRSSSSSPKSKSSSRRKYGPKAQQEVATEMRHLKQGEHKDRQQAIAIGLSKARRAGAKVPPRPKSKAA